MTIAVGDLTVDPTAQSFISLADADAYLGPEQDVAWNTSAPETQEAALIAASRWLALSYRWRPLTEGDLIRVGRIAARLAKETINRPIFAGTDVAKVIKTAKAGSAEITYQDAVRPDAAGLSWPWLRGMLDGLIRERDIGLGVLVV